MYPSDSIPEEKVSRDGHMMNPLQLIGPTVKTTPLFEITESTLRKPDWHILEDGIVDTTPCGLKPLATRTQTHQGAECWPHISTLSLPSPTPRTRHVHLLPVFLSFTAPCAIMLDIFEMLGTLLDARFETRGSSRVGLEDEDVDE